MDKFEEENNFLPLLGIKAKFIKQNVQVTVKIIVASCDVTQFVTRLNGVTPRQAMLILVTMWSANPVRVL